MSQKRFVIWGAWYGSRNIGDRLLLLTITDLLASEFGTFHLTIPTADPAKILEYFNNAQIDLELVKPATQFFRLVRALIRCDLFLFGGGTPFFDQNLHAMVMFFYSMILRLFHKPYFLWCVASYKIYSHLPRFLYKTILNNASAVTCRDQFTVDEFMRIGIKKEPVLVIDSTFTSKDYDFSTAEILLRKYGAEQQGKPYFALTPRTLRLVNKEAQTHYPVKKQKDIDRQIEVYSIAVNWLNENGYQPLFIPMNTNPPDDDRIVAREIIQRLPDPSAAILIDENIMPRVAPALYSKCAGSLVSRVHGSVTSFLGGCPPVMYGFETKHVGIMKSMGLGEQIFNVDSEPGKIIELIKKTLYHRAALIDYCCSQKALLASEAREPLSYIREILRRGIEKTIIYSAHQYPGNS